MRNFPLATVVNLIQESPLAGGRPRRWNAIGAANYRHWGAETG